MAGQVINIKNLEWSFFRVKCILYPAVIALYLDD